MPCGNELAEGRQGGVGIFSIGGGNDSNRDRGGWSILPPPSEHHSSLYCNLDNTLSVSGGGEGYGSKGDTNVVRTGGS